MRFIFFVTEVNRRWRRVTRRPRRRRARRKDFEYPQKLGVLLTVKNNFLKAATFPAMGAYVGMLSGLKVKWGDLSGLAERIAGFLCNLAFSR